ncbi:MAG: hypothetical protein RMK84_03400 [Oscillochloridaceae bacterium]|nr:hypothetical protein [Chloroflexaceae bacterium]MDW8389150.1 hypothetical protein [Oscillochloridaceae bacterium]
MPDLLIVPGAPCWLLSMAGALLALLGLTLRHDALAPAAALVRARWLDTTGRLVAGQIAGGAAATLLLLAAASGARGAMHALLLCGALGAYLGLGWLLPRWPERRRQREAAALRRLTPGFVAFVRVALGSFEAPIEIMRRYVARPYPRLAPMQALVSEALQRSADLRLRPFAALAHVARERGCRELLDVARALAQAEAEGGSVEEVLAAHQATLTLILQGEFKRAIRRRTLYLLLMVAISLVVGILINLLFVMTVGGSLFTRLG